MGGGRGCRRKGKGKSSSRSPSPWHGRCRCPFWFSCLFIYFSNNSIRSQRALLRKLPQHAPSSCLTLAHLPLHLQVHLLRSSLLIIPYSLSNPLPLLPPPPKIKNIITLTSDLLTSIATWSKWPIHPYTCNCQPLDQCLFVFSGDR